MPILTPGGKTIARHAPMVWLAALLVPAAIAACAAGSETGLIGVPAGINAGTASGVSTEPADGGGTSSPNGTASEGPSSSGSSGGTSGGKGDASGSDSGSSGAGDASEESDASEASSPEADSGAPDATDANASDADDASDGATTSCPISITKDTYNNSYNGFITYVNTGAGSERNPTVSFNVPASATLDKNGCAGSGGLDNQGVPSSIIALSCDQIGTTIVYAFTGTVPANAQMALYYSTDLPSEAAATEVTVTATNCP
jgi:hypothetical protein